MYIDERLMLWLCNVVILLIIALGVVCVQDGYDIHAAEDIVLRYSNMYLSMLELHGKNQKKKRRRNGGL